MPNSVKKDSKALFDYINDFIDYIKSKFPDNTLSGIIIIILIAYIFSKIISIFNIHINYTF